MRDQKEKIAAPPYVPYRTLRSFLERFKQGVPGRVDRGVMNAMSGAVQSQVKTALRYLLLISEHDIPSELMKALCVAEGDSRKSVLKTIIKSAYPYMFDDPSFEFSSATGSQVREQIEKNTTATGETVNRCLAFLKDIALDAGIAVSPFFHQKRQKNGARKSRAPAESARATKNATEHVGEYRAGNPGINPPTTHIPAQDSLLLWGLFRRLPKPGSVWPKADREQWTATLNNVLVMEYREKESA